MRPMYLGSLAALLLSLLVARSVSAVADPQLTFAADTVTATGVTPGGQVVWWTSAREVAADYYTTLTHHEAVAAADAAGQSSYDARGVPPQSVWVAVDLSTGAYALGGPGGFLRPFTLSADSFKPGVATDLVTQPRELLQILLIRPGQGAWEASVADGTPADEDGLPGNGGVAVSLGQPESPYD